MAIVTLTDEARQQLSELPRSITLRMEKLLRRLHLWPHVSGVKRLSGDLAGKCRLRTGDYRLQFHVEQRKRKVTEKRMLNGNETAQEREIIDYIVVIEKIGHRDGFYEE